jgi:hypothetical protein
MAFLRTDHLDRMVEVMMAKQYRQASAYLDDAKFAAIAAIARSHDRSLSSHLKHLIEREIARAGDGKKDIVALQTEILIGVDALLKHHPDKTVFGIVKATRAARLGGSSDGA